jgi:hypothetical protein
VTRMRALLLAGLLGGLMGAAGSACADEPSREGGAMPPGHGIAPGPTSSASPGLRGTVLTTMDAGRYTYIEFDTGDEKVWAAVPHQEVQVGDTVHLRGEMPMRDFSSPTLGRRFDLIYFTASVVVTSGEAADSMGVSSTCPPGAQDPAGIDFSGIPRAESGKTIGELFEHRDELVGQQVAVRGKVVKCLSGIMGKNWMHVRDGTAGPGDEDELTVTSQEAAGVGSTLVARGTVVVDKDYGHGYAYDLLLEDATITVE